MIRLVGILMALVFFVLLPRAADCQPDILIRTSTNAIKDWVSEKNLLLRKFGVSIQTDVAIEDTLSRTYVNKAVSFLKTGDSYDNTATYAMGSEASRFLWTQGFYTNIGVTKEKYLVENVIAKQSTRNVKEILDQALIIYLIQKPGEKNVRLTSEFLQNTVFATGIIDDCKLPPQTRLWCKH